MFSNTAHVLLAVVVCDVGLVCVGWNVTYAEEILCNCSVSLVAGYSSSLFVWSRCGVYVIRR